MLRRLRTFAVENELPFLCVCAGDETRQTRGGNNWLLELGRSKFSFPIDGKLKYDPLLWRHKTAIGEALAEFQPDIIHVTGANDVSQLGFFFAHFRRVPAVASWHTNTHEYAARRLVSLLPLKFPHKFKNFLSQQLERAAFSGLMKLNSLAQIQLAPNEELIKTIRTATRRSTFLMSRGVDTESFAPAKRCRDATDDTVTLGYVGRLRPEKNVRFLATIERELRERGVENYKFVIVGEGSEADWLKRNLTRAELTGVLHGEQLSRAYANMDLFVFPSRTDAFGNVVLEAMASGVPGVVMAEGGPKFLIEDGVSGFVARSDSDFSRLVVDFAQAGKAPPEMREAARAAACKRSWTSIFEGIYRDYRFAVTVEKHLPTEAKMSFSARTP